MEATGKRYIYHSSRSDEFALWNLSDIHWLSKSCAEKEVRKDIKQIRDDPFAFWISTGDLADFISYDDRKRFDPTCASPRMKVSDLAQLGDFTIKELTELLHSIKHKCLGIGLGNHELMFQKYHQQRNLQRELCSNLGVVDLQYSGFFGLSFVRLPDFGPPVFHGIAPDRPISKSVTFSIFYHHGSGHAATSGGKLNRLKKFMDNFVADIYMIGHLHEKMPSRRQPLAPNSTFTNIVHRNRIGVMSGAYLKTYQKGVIGYGEVQGYDPVTMGAAWVRINPETRKLTAEI